MRQRIAAFVLVTLCASSAFGQDPPVEVTPLTLMRQLSLRLDNLQLRSDETLPGKPNTAIALIGARVEQAPGEQYSNIIVDGWGLVCSEPGTGNQAKPIVVVDDIEVGDAAKPYNRTDVQSILTEYYCAPLYNLVAPLDSGVHAIIDARAFGLGPAGDGKHSVKLRLYDQLGRIRDSPPVVVVVP